MDSDQNDEDDSSGRRVVPDKAEQAGPYFLRTLIDNIQLLADESDAEVEITCVEFWDGNLYIGTSEAEVLHFVLVAAEELEIASTPSFILASRSQPPFAPRSSGEAQNVGVQQILLLTKANKACILCNGTLTFYSLPELSPTFAGTQVRNCNWVGGIDLNLDARVAEQHGEVIMLSLKSRIRLVKIGEEPRPVVIRNIEYPGSLISVRRGSFACVANGHSYALLDVEHQQKIPLFPISSLEGNSEGMVGGKAVDISLSSASASQQRPGLRAKSAGHGNESHNHGRSTSLGVIFGGLGRREQSPRPRSQDRAELRQDAALVDGTPPALSQSDGMVVPDGKESLPRTTSYDKPLPLPPDTPRDQPGISQTPFTSQSSFLKPHVLSPTSNEFLLTTGTTSSDRGVGVFVNMDGDVCRSTIEFQRYPEAVVLDLQETDASSHGAVPEQSSQGYVLTAMEGSEQYPGEKGIEIQRLDGDEEDIWEKKAWLRVPLAATGSATGSPATPHKKIGIQELNSACVISSIELSKALQLVRLRLLNDSPLDDSEDVSHKPGLQSLPSQNGPPENGNGLTQASRNEIPATNEKLIQSRDASRLREEEQFARRFSMQYSRLVLWAGNQIWLMVRNPLAMRLEATLESAVTQSSGAHAIIDRSVVIEVLDNIRGQESTTETHFLSLGYIRQKASLFLFISLMEALSNEMAIPAEETQRTEESLLEGTVDPRVLMAMVPLLRQDIEEGQQGIWIHGGVRSHVEHYISSAGHLGWGETQPGVFNRDLLYILRRYLSTWRRKKGFGSVADEKQVFESVDAGLLHVLLELDKINILGSVAGHSVRTDLYALVDQGVDSFDRAIVLLERYQRLYVLSRLYQSRKLSGKVLSTWRRILEGDVDEGGEFVNGENEVKKYLAMVRDPGLVEDYGSWLARRNPRLGVQVFADERSRVRLPPDKIIEVLRSRAPNSLREYLEHMVFGRNMSRYVNDLIFLYLDGVLPVLESSEHARAILSQSYEAYRALRPPRPTYREFITENSIDEQWWHDRLRLLQLLGGSHGAVLGYDVPAALGRIEPFEKELVPEMIILDGKQARHRPALRLLIHGLGDYDSAINYCLLGGSSIFYPTFGAAPQEVVPSPEEQAVLFGHLLSEFLQISDPEDRAEQTGGLLERFGRWYDASQVLRQIPDSWSIEMVSGFLVSTLRRLLAEHNETTMTKALSGAENLKISAQQIDRYEEIGPVVRTVE